MPTRTEVDAYRLGIRLGQCSALHARCINDGVGPDDVSLLKFTIRSLGEAFQALSRSAGLSQAQIEAGKALAEDGLRLWNAWSRMPTDQLPDYTGLPDGANSTCVSNVWKPSCSTPLAKYRMRRRGCSSEERSATARGT
jgi:hypothetical protein